MEELIQIMIKWKKYITILSLLAILLSSVLTMPAILPPYFESRMIFYVSNPLSTDRSNLFNQENVANVSIFGTSTDADRFITIAQSSAVINPILEKYNLKEHYKIKQKNQALNEYYTKKEFNSLVKIIRNDADAIELSVLDTDAKLAAKIAKDIVHNTEQINQQLIIDNKKKVLQQIEYILKEKSTQTNTTSTEQENLAKLYDLKNQYEIATNNEYKTIYIIEDAGVSPKKAYPIRWQIVLISLILTLFTSILLAVVYEQIQAANTK